MTTPSSPLTNPTNPEAVQVLPVRHGRHCPCSACAREDWTRPVLAPCDYHGVQCAYSVHGDHPLDAYTYEGCAGCHPKPEPVSEPQTVAWAGCPTCGHDQSHDPHWWDNPALDGTDGAHPAWWRGSDHTAKVLADARSTAEHSEQTTLRNSRELVEQYQAQLQAADAQLVQLREALEAVWSAVSDEGEGDTPLVDLLAPDLYDQINRVLNSTAEDNKEALARIREEAPLRQALTEVLHDRDIDEIAQGHYFTGPSRDSVDGLGQCECGDPDCEVSVLLDRIRQARALLTSSQPAAPTEAPRG